MVNIYAFFWRKYYREWDQAINLVEVIPPKTLIIPCWVIFYHNNHNDTCLTGFNVFCNMNLQSLMFSPKNWKLEEKNSSFSQAHLTAKLIELVWGLYIVSIYLTYCEYSHFTSEALIYLINSPNSRGRHCIIHEMRTVLPVVHFWPAGFLRGDLGPGVLCGLFLAFSPQSPQMRHAHGLCLDGSLCEL
jgi:hypothetical protein